MDDPCVKFIDKKYEYYLIIFTSILITISFLIVTFYGRQLPWYVNLPVKTSDNVYLLAFLWIIAILISYISFYRIRNKDEHVYGQSRLIIYYLIVSYLNLLWIVLYFYYANFNVSLLILSIIFILQLYMILFLYRIDKLSSIFLIPVQILYGYLIYSILHTASINDIII